MESTIFTPVSYALEGMDGTVDVTLATQDNTVKTISYLEENHIKPEFMAHNWEGIRNVKEWLIKPGILKKPYFISMGPGMHNTAETYPDPWGLLYVLGMMQMMPEDTVIGVSAGGRNWLALSAFAILMGVDFVRVGMEDHLWMYPHKDEIKGFAGYLKRQVEKLGVEVQLGMEVTAQSLEELAPDVVIIATGAVPFIPEIEGVMQDSVVTARDVLAGNCEVGPRVVVIGGGQVGCETAEFLAGRGVGVSIVEMLDRMAPDMSFWSREVLLRRLLERGVDMLTQAKVTEIKGKTVILDRGGIEERVENIDDVVLAAGYEPRDNTDLIDWAERRGIEYYRVGDCVAPRNIMYAVQEGFEAGSGV